MVLAFAFQYYRQHLDQLAGHDALYGETEGLCQGIKPQVDEYRLLYGKVGGLHGPGHRRQRRQEHIDPCPGERNGHEHPEKSPPALCRGNDRGFHGQIIARLDLCDQPS